jgi:hypothetical protein
MGEGGVGLSPLDAERVFAMRLAPLRLSDSVARSFENEDEGAIQGL